MERWLPRAAFALLSLVAVGRVWLFEIVSVSNDSMAPALLAGELVWVWRGPLSEVHPGAVVLYSDSGVVSLKRIVAEAGQVVELTDGVLFVDGGSVRQETRIEQVARGCGVSEVTVSLEQWGEVRAPVLPAGDIFEEQIPPGHVYILGDNRAESSDSRQWGPLPASAIIGSAGRVLWSRDECGAMRWFRIGARVR
jgi:signal peptidase I